MTLVSSKQISELLGITVSRIEQLVNSGILPREARGKYPPAACVQAYIAYRESLVRESENVSAADYEKHRARLTKARADKAEMEAVAYSGEFHHGAETAEVVGEMLARFRSKVLAGPAISAPRVADVMDASVCQEILMEAAHDMLVEMAGGYDGEEVVARFNGRNRVGDEAPAEEDVEPVERPSSPVKQRGKRGAGKVANKPG